MTRRYGSKPPSKASQRTALAMVIAHRESLGTIEPASLARSYGVPEWQVAGMIAEEMARRGRAA